SVVASVVYNGTHLPPGYLYSALIWVGVTNASGQFQAFQQQDHQIAVGPASVLSATASVANTYASLSLSSIVPYSAVSCFGTLGTSTSNFGASLAIAASSAGAYAQYFIGQSNTNVLDGLYGACQFGPLPMVTPQTAWWKAATTTQTFNIFIRAYNF
ncbi:MAG: hypothetical protein KGL35_16275, partial [Bradyrhizobium sp.]|nr:hypothetical protein [Bradyrhizobium sp.]